MFNEIVSIIALQEDAIITAHRDYFLTLWNGNVSLL